MQKIGDRREQGAEGGGPVKISPEQKLSLNNSCLTFQSERIWVRGGGHEAHADQLRQMQHQEVGTAPAEAHLLGSKNA